MYTVCKRYLGYLIIIASIYTLPSIALAAEEHRTLNTTFLFTLTYRVTTTDTALTIPISATRNRAHQNSVGFELIQDAQTTGNSTASGIVLSDASMNDDFTYNVPKHSQEEFTLLVIYNNDNYPKDVEDPVSLFKTFFDVPDASVRVLKPSATLQYSYTTKN